MADARSPTLGAVPFLTSGNARGVVVRLWVLAAGAVGCSTPREMPTVQEMVARAKPAPRCEHLVEILEQSHTTRPYAEVSRLSVACHPALPDMCERSLRARACALHADAVLLMPSANGASRSVPNTRDQVWKSAVLARWR